MWHSILSFGRTSLLYHVAQQHETEGRSIPFTPDEIYRLQFAAPVALLALWFDNAEHAKLHDDARARMLAQAWAQLSATGQAKVSVAKMIVLPMELKAVKKALRVGFFSDISQHIASEEAICRSAMHYRIEGCREVLRKVYQSSDVSLFWSRDTLNAKREEALSQLVVMMATGDLGSIESKDKIFFVSDILATAQEFYDEHAIPAFKP